jgi:hypothetical protein
MSTSIRGGVDRFLEQQKSAPTPQRGRLIFALDATASREHCWDTAQQLQAEMFREVAAIGRLDVQLVYFRGPSGQPGSECRASPWVEDPSRLAKLMSSIDCRAGYTQIARVLTHACYEAGRQKINALVYVGDACEDERDELVQAAHNLAALQVPVFIFQEGREPLVQRRFQEIASITNGACFSFDVGAVQPLAQLLRAIATFAVGGLTALQASSNPGATKLLGSLRC